MSSPDSSRSGGPVRVAAVQAEPRWLDLEAGVAQVTDLIAEAASNGARLVAFSETLIPGYPWWIWLDSPPGACSSFPATRRTP